MTAQHHQPHRVLTRALLSVMWIVFFGFGTFFLNYSTLVSHGQDMGLSSVTAGTVLTIMMVAVVLVQPIVPFLHARFGARLTFFLALTFQAVGPIVTLLTAVPYGALLVGSIISGLGFGILVVIGTAVVPSTVAAARLGRAFGFFGATTTGATAIGAPVGIWLSSMIAVPTFRWLSFALIIMALPAILGVPGNGAKQSADSAADQRQAQRSDSMRVTGLLVTLVPAAVVLTVFGLVLAFGPAAETGSPAIYLAGMQIFVIIGRFISSASLDRFAPVTVMTFGLGITLCGLVLAAVLPAGALLMLAMVILGFGTGTVQAASLLIAFDQAGSANRGSVAWNMTFDIGLGCAGLVGGIGFTYLGADMTYLLCAGALLLVSALFVGYFRTSKCR